MYSSSYLNERIDMNLAYQLFYLSHYSIRNVSGSRLFLILNEKYQVLGRNTSFSLLKFFYYMNMICFSIISIHSLYLFTSIQDKDENTKHIRLGYLSL